MSGALMRAIRAAGPLGLAAAAAVVVVLLVAAGALAPAIAVAVRSSEAADAEAVDNDRHLRRFEETQAGFVAQANGRSLFFVPAPPPPIERPRPANNAEREDPPPAVYAGPKLVGIVGETALFDGDVRLTVGGDAADDLRLVATDAPWFATVEWRGERFEVTLFERTTGQFLLQPEEPERPPTEDQAAQDDGRAQDAG